MPKSQRDGWASADQLSEIQIPCWIECGKIQEPCGMFGGATFIFDLVSKFLLRRRD